MNAQPTVMILASPKEGGSGSRQLVMDARDGTAETWSPGKLLLVSTTSRGGVWQVAQDLGVGFYHLDASNPDEYEQRCEDLFRANPCDFTVMSGFDKLLPASVIRPGRVTNIHPAQLPEFGGKRMHGLRLHREVLASGRRQTAVTVHWVNERYDEGEHIFDGPLGIPLGCVTPEALQAFVKPWEQYCHGRVLAKVLAGQPYVDYAELPMWPRPHQMF